MALPTDYGTGTVIGTFTDTSGDPVVGTVSFTPSASRLLGTGAVILGESVVVELDAEGSLSVDLPASDDPSVNPTDFTYRVDETFVGVVGSTYFIDVLEDTTLDLSDVAVPGVVDNGTVVWVSDTALVKSVWVTDATDGSAETTYLVFPAPGVEASGIIPAGWTALFGPLDAATMATYLTGLGLTGPSVVYCGGAPSIRTLNPATVATEPWPVASGATRAIVTTFGAFRIDLIDGQMLAADAGTVSLVGTGLLGGIGDVDAAVKGLEQTLDRKSWVSAVAESNVDREDLLAASWTYGALDFSGTADPPYCWAWLSAQTDTAEYGIYKVYDDGTYEQLVPPDVPFPPGQGTEIHLKSNDADDGRYWQFTSDDPQDRQRANGSSIGGQTGRWKAFAPAS